MTSQMKIDSPDSTSVIQILCVEDDLADANLIKEILFEGQSQEFSFIYVDCISEAIDCIARQKVDIILLDLSLPNVKGLDGLEQMKKLLSDIPIIVLTGLSDQSLAMESLKKGAQDYFVKGFMDYSHLSRSIRYAIERHRVKSQLNIATQEVRVANARLKQLSLLDPLTDLYNYRGLQQALSNEIQRTSKEGTYLFAVLISVNNFRKLNDSLGYGSGDIILKEIAKKLTMSVGQSDYVARIGGDEFMVLFPNLKEDEGSQVVERIRSHIAEVNIMVNSENIQVSASVGLTKVKESSSLDELLSQTRLSFHHKKDNDKNGTSKDKVISEGDKKRETLVLSVVEAVNKKSDLFYSAKQSIMDLSSGKEVGVEYLIRPRFEGLERPDEFFYFCLEENILTLVDHYCFNACIEASKQLSDELFFHINLFPSTMVDVPTQHLVEKIKQGHKNGNYCVEISEQQIISDPSYLMEPVKELRKAGVKIAIDDVGFGRSCLESLIVLEPDIIKIDKKWVRGAARDKMRHQALKRIILVAKALEAEVIAEGIESEEDLNVIKSIGAKYGQGFYFGKPA